MTEAMVPFYVEPILLELEGGKYVVPLLPPTLAKLVSGRHGGVVNGDGSVSGGGGSGSGGSIDDGGRYGGRGREVGQSGAGAEAGGLGDASRVRVCYETHQPALSLWNRET